MSETTTTTTTTKPKPKPKVDKSNWRFAGYWNVLIGGFVLLLSGFLMFFTYLSVGTSFIGINSFFLLPNIFMTALLHPWLIWFTGLLQLLLGIFILLLVWEWFQQITRIGALIKDPLWLGILLIVLGLITFGLGGFLVIVGGVFYILSSTK